MTKDDISNYNDNNNYLQNYNDSHITTKTTPRSQSTYALNSRESWALRLKKRS